MIVVGITGSLASGKSETVGIFKKLGAKVFDADASAYNAVRKGKPAYKAIVKIFGKQYLLKNKEIDRKKLAWHVFSNPKDLYKLNILIHPTVILDCLNLIEKYRQKKGLLVLDVPLLFESKMENLADTTILISCGQKKTLDRAKKRGVPVELARKILAIQWPMKKKAGLADFVIENNGTTGELEKKISEVVNKFKY